MRPAGMYAGDPAVRRALIVCMLLGCGSEESPPAPVAQPPESACERGCEAAGSCLLVPDDCVARCEKEPEVRACITASGDCTARANCLMKQLCASAAPSGTGSCMSALLCTRNCSETSCVCGCAAAAAPRHTLALARAGQCVLNCAFDETCAKARCGAVIQACALQ